MGTYLRKDWLAAGVGDKVLRGPAFVSPFPGVFVRAGDADDPAVRAAAVLAAFPAGACLSHASAARIWRFPVDLPATDWVSVPRSQDRRRRAGIECVVSLGLGDAQVVVRAGARTTTPIRTFLDLGARCGLVDLVAIGDHLVRRHGLTREDVWRATAAFSGAGARQLRRAAALVRAGVDSGPESRLRMLLVLAGLPEPEVNLVIRDEWGEPVRQHDLGYPSARLALEYDGRHHIEREDRWHKDLARREAMDRLGWRTLVITATDLFREPAATLERAHETMRAREVSGLPRRLSPRWRQYFPTR